MDPNNYQSAPPAAPQAGEPRAVAFVPNDDDKEFLDARTKDYERLQKQKSRKTGGVEARVLLAQAFTWGEHYVSQQERGLVAEVLDPNKLYLVFNMIEHRLGKLIGRLSSIAPVYHARPDKKDPIAESEAEVVDRLILALDEKLDQASRTWEILYWMATGGVAFEYIPWIPNATIEPVAQFDAQNQLLFKNSISQEIIPETAKDQQVAGGVPPEQFEVYEEIQTSGDVGSEILGPLSVFVDQSVRSIADLAPDQWVYVAKIRTMGWIEENFGPQTDWEPDKEFKIVTTSIYQDGAATASLFLTDMIPMVQGASADDDPPMAVVVEGYCPASGANPRGIYTCFVPKKKVLYKNENPYNEIPLVDFHWRPVTTTFWTKDYVTDLIAPQRFINKRISQLGEHANSSIYDKLLLGSTLTAADIPTDFPGVVTGGVSEQGQPNVIRLPGPQLPGWFLESVNVVTKLFDDIAGGNDLFGEEKFLGAMRGPSAVPMLQEILDTEWGPLYMHIGQRMAKVKEMRLARVKQFYPPIRTFHYTDEDMRDEVMEFHADKTLRSGTSFNITVERGSLLPELRALNEDRVKQRLSSPLAVLYTDDRTGKIDKSKVAADLKMGAFSREGREAQARTFQGKLIDKMRKGEQIPPVMQFWDHAPMMDELESHMMTTEFLSVSPPIQQIFMDRWQQHMTFLQQAAAAQQQSMQNHMIQGAAQQAIEQAAAQAAAETVHSMRQAKQSAQQPQTTQPAQTPPAFAGTQAMGLRPPTGQPVGPQGGQRKFGGLVKKG